MIVWSGLRHPNIVELIGYLYDEANYPMLVSKWMENGTALEYVEKCSVADVLDLVKGIANGLFYLHLLDVVHSDLKSARSLNNTLLCCNNIHIFRITSLSRMPAYPKSATLDCPAWPLLLSTKRQQTR